MLLKWSLDKNMYAPSILFGPFEHLYTIVWKMIYVLLKMFIA